MFLEDHNPTIEDSYLQNVEVDGEWCVLDGTFDLLRENSFTCSWTLYVVVIVNVKSVANSIIHVEFCII